MTEPTSISVLIAVFNGRRFLGEALDSVLRQSRPPLEVIVVDDGSTDGALELAATYGERVVTVRQENAGAAVALNRAVHLARGQFFGFIDADDLWLPSKLELQAAALEAQPELDFVLGQVRQFHSPELDEAERQRLPLPPDPEAARWTGSMLIRREAFLRVGLFQPEYRMSWQVDWFMRASEAKLHSRILPEVLAMRRLHRDNQGRREKHLRTQYVTALHAGLRRRRQQQAAEADS